jgi:hypothetical protein
VVHTNAVEMRKAFINLSCVAPAWGEIAAAAY